MVALQSDAAAHSIPRGNQGLAGPFGIQPPARPGLVSESQGHSDRRNHQTGRWRQGLVWWRWCQQVGQLFQGRVQDSFGLYIFRELWGEFSRSEPRTATTIMKTGLCCKRHQAGMGPAQQLCGLANLFLRVESAKTKTQAGSRLVFG